MSRSPRNARLAAMELLVAVLDHGRTLDEAMETTPAYARLEGRDRGFARAMTAAALRRLGGIDAILAQYLARPLEDSAAYARALLRLGAAQLLVLNTPAHAAVSETVDAANASRAKPFAKLMNAVLRKVASEGPALLAAQAPGADLPDWLYARWRAAYGAERAAAIAEALHHEAPLDVSVKQDASGWATRLLGDVTPSGSVRVTPSPGAINELPGFSEGAWWVQDAAAALPARLLGDVAGQDVLDLCAAPGGKTLQLAALGANVTAVDRSDERLAFLKQNLARTGLSAKVVCADALSLRAKEKFDAVLLDAPCTATGTLRRHPEAAWQRKPSDIRTMTELQGQLLAAAADMIKPGGKLIYAVCSLEPEEGPGVIATALAGGAWTRDLIKTGEIPGLEGLLTDEGELRTLPAHWREQGGMDGFYAVRLSRSAG